MAHRAGSGAASNSRRWCSRTTFAQYAVSGSMHSAQPAHQKRTPAERKRWGGARRLLARCACRQERSPARCTGASLVQFTCSIAPPPFASGATCSRRTPSGTGTHATALAGGPAAAMACRTNAGSRSQEPNMFQCWEYACHQQVLHVHRGSALS